MELEETLKLENHNLDNWIHMLLDQIDQKTKEIEQEKEFLTGEIFEAQELKNFYDKHL